MIISVRSGEHEIVIKKSRFIAYSFGIESREDVLPIIAELKQKHSDARHVCYAFIADEKGLDFGYDDNGEPSGTAGKPIHSALAAVEARKSLIAVVRYFGGIKLGAGGLTRAYRQSAAELIENVGLSRVEKYAVYSLEADSETFKKVAAVLRGMAVDISDIKYGMAVECRITAAPDVDVCGAVAAFGVSIVKLGEKYLLL